MGVTVSKSSAKGAQPSEPGSTTRVKASMPFLGTCKATSRPWLRSEDTISFSRNSVSSSIANLYIHIIASRQSAAISCLALIGQYQSIRRAFHPPLLHEGSVISCIQYLRGRTQKRRPGHHIKLSSFSDFIITTFITSRTALLLAKGALLSSHHSLEL
jgi:hypothetical protein